MYRFPSVVLAAGAMGAADLAAGTWCPDSHETLLEDVASYYPELCDARSMVHECEAQLLEMWQECTQGTSQWSSVYSPLRERYCRPRQNINGAASYVRLGEILVEPVAEATLQR